MKKDEATYVAKCLTCHKMKVEHQRAPRELQPLDIPKWKWDIISLDFVSSLPRTRHNYDTILFLASHFVHTNIRYKLEKLAKLYIKKVVKLHGVPSSIVSDKDPRFTSKFWESVQKSLGMKLKLSSANRRIDETDHSIFRGTFKGMHDGTTRQLGRAFISSEIHIQQ